MALFVNNKSVVSYCFVANDEIKLLKIRSSGENSEEYYSIKCPAPQKSELSKESQPKYVKEQCIVSAAVSNDCNYVSASDSNNLLHLWKWEKNSWDHSFTQSLLRKCQKIIFTNSESEVIVADRSGDVYGFPVFDDQKKGKFLLGHISLIIDIAISSDDRYLLTSDRDGKVRVSYYPNCYNIHSYCLGHQEFVSSVQCVTLNKELILTTSGDGSIKLWDFEGNNIRSINLYENEAMLGKLELCGVNSKSEEKDGNQLPYLLNEKQVAFAVKRASYTPKSNLCAIIFYSIKGIGIYHISELKSSHFDFIGFIPLDSVPFDVFFDIDDNLVILQNSIENQYLYYKLLVDDKIFFKALDSSNVSMSERLQKLNFNIVNFKEVHDDFETLFKRHFDNCDDKEENLETQKETLKKIKSK